jgi:hypothetical protein
MHTVLWMPVASDCRFLFCLSQWRKSLAGCSQSELSSPSLVDFQKSQSLSPIAIAYFRLSLAVHHLASCRHHPLRMYLATSSPLVVIFIRYIYISCLASFHLSLVVSPTTPVYTLIIAAAMSSCRHTCTESFATLYAITFHIHIQIVCLGGGVFFFKEGRSVRATPLRQARVLSLLGI